MHGMTAIKKSNEKYARISMLSPLLQIIPLLTKCRFYTLLLADLLKARDIHQPIKKSEWSQTYMFVWYLTRLALLLLPFLLHFFHWKPSLNPHAVKVNQLCPINVSEMLASLSSHCHSTFLKWEHLRNDETGTVTIPYSNRNYQNMWRPEINCQI